jgi:ubiquinone/menaquinone biosynthesis C-methylase UbiE
MIVIDVDELGVRDAYASWADTYDGPNPLITAEEPVVRRFLEGIDAGRALDVACGTGRLTRLLSDVGHRVIGLDASAEMLACVPRNAPGAALVHGNLLQLPIKDRN